MAGGMAQEQLKKMGNFASKMSALEVAALGKNLASANLAKETGEPMTTALEMDAQDEDWQPLIEEAKGNGPLSWFSQNVDFKLHEAQFLGKVGYSVKGGVVPLFDGAAIDLKFASLESKKPKDASADPVLGDPSAYENWVEGEGGMLVLAPVGMDNVVPVSMQHVTVTEQGLSGVAEKHMEFRAGDKTLTAEKLTLTDEKIVLSSVSEILKGMDTPKDNLEAVITGEGVIATEAAGQTSDAGEPEDIEKIEEMETVEDTGETKETGDSQAEVVSKGDGVNKDELPTVPIYKKTNLIGKIEKKIEEKVEEFVKGDKEDDDGDDDKKEESIKDAAKNLGKEAGTAFGQAIALGEKEEDNSKVEKKTKLKVGEGSAGVSVAKKEEEDDPTLISDVATSMAEEAGSVIHEALSVGKDTLKEGGVTHKTSWQEAAEKMREPFIQKYEQGKDVVNAAKSDDEKAGLQKLAETGKDLLHGNAGEDEVKEALEGAVPLSELKTLLGMNEDDSSDEASSSTEEKDSGGPISLASIPLLPLVSFDVTLTPEVKFQPYAKAEVRNLWNLLKKNKDSEQTDLEFEAGIKSTLSLAAKAGFTEGIPYIFQGFQRMVATASMEGNVKPLEGSLLPVKDGVALMGNAKVGVKRGTNGALKQAGDAKVSVKGGFDLKGSVGAEVGVESKLFSWNKNLIEKTFAEWDLLQIGLNLDLSKKPAGSLLDGWKLDEASIELKRDRGVGKAFVENNTEERKYGLTTPDTKESEEYKNLQNDFRSALNLLKRFATPKKEEALLIPTGQEDSGYAETLENLHEFIVTFGGLWASSQRELEHVNTQLEEYMASELVAGKQKDLKDKIAQHRSLANSMKNWKAGSLKDEKGNQISTMQYYTIMDDDSGDGFEKHLKEKVENQVYSFEAIAKYEKDRYKEITKVHTARIAMLKKSIEANKSDEEIVAEYKKAGGKRVFDNKAKLQTKEALIAFEEKGMLADQEKARNHLKETMGLAAGKDVKKAKEEAAKKGKDKSKEEREEMVAEAGRIAFFQKYAKNLDADDHRDILYRFGDRKMLMDYERNSLRDKAGDFVDQYESKTALTERDNKQKKAVIDEFYKTATVDELIEFETQVNRGAEGAMLEEYKKSGKTAQKDGNELDRIFGNGFLGGQKSNALSKFKKRLEGRSVDDNVKYITIDLLFEYARKRQKKAKKMEEKKKIAEELLYLNQSKVILEATPPDKLADAEAKEVKAYFNRYKDSGAQYQKDLQSGEEVNLELMQAVFAEDSENGRMKILREGKEKGKTDTEILTEYLAAKGADKKKLTEFLYKKHTGKNNKLIVDPDRLKRFYKMQMRSKNQKHYDRYMKLEELYQDGAGADYATMLKEYVKLGGGEGYAKQILTELGKTGTVNGRKISMEEAIGYEGENVEAAGKKHQNRLDMIEKRSNQGMDTREIIAEYEEKSKEDWGYIKSKLGYFVNWRSDFEKSLKDVTLTPAQLLEYEENRRNEVGEKHEKRIKELYGLKDSEALPEDLDALKPPPQEKMEEQKKAYMEEAKRFKEDDALKNAVKEELARRMSSDALQEEILSYEQSQKEHYEEELQAQLKVHEDLINRKNTLEQEVNLSRNLAYNIEELKTKPEAIFSRIADFEEAVNWTQEAEKKQETLKQENETLIKEADDVRDDETKKLPKASGE